MITVRCILNVHLCLQEPLGYFELKQCITDTVKLIPGDVCARKNTFELITVRRQNKGETDTIVSRCYNTMITTKYVVAFYKLMVFKIEIERNQNFCSASIVTKT